MDSGKQIGALCIPIIKHNIDNKKLRITGSSTMRITIVGSGHAGTTVAADLKSKGHTVTVLKTSHMLHDDHFGKIVQDNGKLIFEEDGHETEVTLDCVTRDYGQALSDAELIIIYVQTNFHEHVINEMSKYIKDGQIILIEPGYLSTLFFIKYCNDKKITIVEAESSPIDCRIIKPGYVKVLFRNVRNPIGVYPNHEKLKAISKLDELGYHFILTESVIEAALHNPNLIVHTVGAIMSIPRIEHSNGDYWMYREVFTPHVWNMVLALDNEKMDILEKLGLERLSYVEACKIRNSNDLATDATEVFFDYANNHSPKGPTAPDSRYVTEDVPEGLVLLESLGQILKIDTPVCSGLINLASAALKRDFRKEGRNIDRIGIEIFNQVLNYDN